MSELRQKSGENLKASDLLIRASFYNSSVHCAYYACVQLMLHILRSDLGMTEKEISNGDSENGGFHAWIINIIGTAFLKKKKTEEGRTFRSQIESLRKFRRKSDYDNYLIDERKAKQAKENAESITQLIKDNFTV